VSLEEPLPGHPEVVLLRAPNPGPMTLAGTNTWVVGADPAMVIDPGPAIPEHLERIAELGASRGGIGGILLTHSHVDHSEAVGSLAAELLWGQPSRSDEGAALLAALDAPRVEPVTAGAPAAESEVGSLRVVPTPGHAADHVAFVLEDGDRVVFCGDLILGEGSSIVPPRAAGGSLADYLASLERLERLEPAVLCPGHGAVIDDPAAKIAEYRAHRLERERRLLDALDAGERSRAALLARVWDDVPPLLRAAAALALQAHLEKLAADGVELAELAG
jgi:glyoxylase-like metal-dependent hydrolase (beta-lactamase superfamily II)